MKANAMVSDKDGKKYQDIFNFRFSEISSESRTKLKEKAIKNTIFPLDIMNCWASSRYDKKWEYWNNHYTQ